MFFLGVHSPLSFMAKVSASWPPPPPPLQTDARLDPPVASVRFSPLTQAGRLWRTTGSSRSSRMEAVVRLFLEDGNGRDKHGLYVSLPLCTADILFSVAKKQYKRFQIRSRLTLAGTGGGGWCNPPLVFRDDSWTDRPIVTKLGVPNQCTILHLPWKFQVRTDIDLWPTIDLPLTCDLISKVMSSEICVPYRFNAWNLRTSACLLVIWTWIGVGRWHPWFTLTFWPFRGQPRSSEVNDLWRRHISFFGYLWPQR